MATPAHHRRRRVAAPSTALRLAGDGDRGRCVSGGHVPQPTPLADVLEVLDARALPPARPLQRPGQHRRQAQLARPPELPPQRDRRRGRRRVLDARRSGRRRASVARLVAFVVAPQLERARRSSPRCASASTRRSCRAASSRSKPAARADRQADRRRAWPSSPAAHGGAATGAVARARMDAPCTRSRLDDRRRPSGLRRPLPRPAAAARRRAAGRGARGGARRAGLAARDRPGAALAVVKFLAPVGPGAALDDRASSDSTRARRFDSRRAATRGRRQRPSSSPRADRRPGASAPTEASHEQPAPTRRRRAGRASASAATCGCCA